MVISLIMVMENTTISISKEFNSYLESHGRYGETKESILIRLLGDKIKIPAKAKRTQIKSSKHRAGGKA